MSSRDKRKKQPPNNNSNKNTNNGKAAPAANKPAAPGPAPKSLVALIQKNKKVHNYFTALSENLEYDVRKWKDRARHYEALWKEAQAEKKRLQQEHDRRKQDDNDSGEKSPTRKRQRKKVGTATTEEQPISRAVPNIGTPTSVNQPNVTGPPKTIHVGTQPPEESAAAAIDDEMDHAVFESESSDSDDNDNHKKVPTIAKKKRNNNNDKGAKQNTGEETTFDDMFEFELDNDDSDNSNSNNASETFRAPARPRTATNKHRNESHDREDSENSDTANSEKQMQSPQHPITKRSAAASASTVETTTPSWKEHYRFIASELLDAYRCLQYLGINLVVVDEVKSKSVDNDISNDGDTDKGIDAAEQTKGTDHEELREDNEEEEFSFLPGKSDTDALKKELADHKATHGETETFKKTALVLERRPDEDVVTDMLDAVRSLTRIHVHTYGGLSPEYHPFRVAPHWFPCGDKLPVEHTPATATQRDQNASPASMVDHPARIGKICLFRALSVLDCYASAECIDLAPNYLGLKDPWDQLRETLDDILVNSSGAPLENQNVKQSILVGMLNRKEMVNSLLKSLSGEVGGAWAVTDRSARMQSDVLHYDETDVRGEELESDKNEENDRGINVLQRMPQLFRPAGTKSYVRLASLAERRVLAQLMVGLYLARKDPCQAFQSIWDYTLSAATSLGVEEYPRMPPVLSIVILEGMLVKDNDLTDMLKNDQNELCSSEKRQTEEGDMKDEVWAWLNRALSCTYEAKLGDTPNSQQHMNSLPRKVLALSIHIAGFIWGQRLQSTNDRITDVARVEWACYLRLLESQTSWLTTDTGPVDANVDDSGRSIQSPASLERYENCLSNLVESIQLSSTFSEKSNVEGNNCAGLGRALSLALVLLGETEKAVKLVGQTTTALVESSAATKANLTLVHATCMAGLNAFRQIKIRQVDIFQQQRVGFSMGSVVSVSPWGPGGAMGPECLTALFQLLKAKVMSFEGSSAVSFAPLLVWDLSAIVLQGCCLVSNGELAFEVVQLLLAFGQFLRKGNAKNEEENPLRIPKNLTETIKEAAEIPFVRVINLERRKDRWISFVAQSMESSVLVARGVTLSTGWEEKDSQVDHQRALQAMGDERKRSDLYGGFAIDGHLTLEEITSQVFKARGDLEEYVAPRWRPHDLKPFDTKSTDDENALVRISDSERSCALSHIQTWKGVLHSLQGEDRLLQKPENSLFHHEGSLRRLFLSSGFARGHPLEHSNIGMPPRPVCVILEDDAILCDRFADRLDSLLEELPRDFHFCSLGYGRPATAPLVKFSSQLSIPTCVWYLTGYIVSLEGARHLLESLPVRGPVDSWIGLKMCSNWDNSFGEAVGVGFQSKPRVEGPPRKDLSMILKFRAFAALDPLCSQKVVTGGSGAAGVAGRNWRQRDTDITYSGSENYSG